MNAREREDESLDAWCITRAPSKSVPPVIVPASPSKGTITSRAACAVTAPKQPRVGEHDEQRVANAPRDSKAREVDLSLAPRRRFEADHRGGHQRRTDALHERLQLRVARISVRRDRQARRIASMMFDLPPLFLPTRTVMSLRK